MKCIQQSPQCTVWGTITENKSCGAAHLGFQKSEEFGSDIGNYRNAPEFFFRFLLVNTSYLL